MDSFQKYFPICFITALPFETNIILSQHKNNLISKENNLKLYQLNKIGYLIEVGLGVKADLQTILKFFQDISPALVINFGICGALNTGLRTGNSFIINQICIPNLQTQKLKPVLTGFSTKSIYTSSKPILSSNERDVLFKETSCDLVDMEAGILYQLCNKSNIIFQSLKVVSDYSDENTVNWLKNNRSIIKADLKNAYEKLLKSLSK